MADAEQAVLRRMSVRFRHLVKGSIVVDGYDAGALSLASAEYADPWASAEALRAWDAERYRLHGDELKAHLAHVPGPVVRAGYVVVHALSGRQVTPRNRLLADLDAAKACLRRLYDSGADWSQPAPLLWPYRGQMVAAHDVCGAFDFEAAHVRRLWQSVDRGAMAERQAELRSGPTSDAFRDRAGRATAFPETERRMV